MAASQPANYPSLRDRGVIVTGGASGIGADMVRAFAGQGAKTAFLDLLDADASALIAELGTARHVPRYLHCDLTDIAALRAAMASLGARLGGVSVLVNNAANDTRHQIAEVTPEMWDALLAINLKAQFFAAQALLPLMKDAGGGAVINLSSIAWRFGPDAMAVYGAAKAGVHGLTRALARAFGPHAITVNSIEPGAVMTDRQRKLWYPTQASVDAMIERQIIRQPLLGEHIARAALFLASDDARMITRQAIVVDAGMS